MRTFRFPGLLAVVSVALHGCSSGPTSGGDDPCAECVVITSDAGPASLLDPSTVESAVVQDDELRLRLSFGGGCETHEFRAFAPAEFTVTRAIELAVWVWHDDHDDPCDAIVREDVVFDLSTVRQLYLATYGVPGVLLLRIHTAPGEETVVFWDLRG